MAAKKVHDDNLIGGVILLALGVLFLLNNTLDINFHWAKYWPILLVIAGLYIILNKLRK